MELHNLRKIKVDSDEMGNILDLRDENRVQKTKIEMLQKINDSLNSEKNYLKKSFYKLSEASGD